MISLPLTLSKLFLEYSLCIISRFLHLIFLKFLLSSSICFIFSLLSLIFFSLFLDIVFTVIKEIDIERTNASIFKFSCILLSILKFDNKEKNIKHNKKLIPITNKTFTHLFINYTSSQQF